MSFLLNPFGTFGAGAPTTYFVVAGAAEATGNLALAGMQAGDLAVSISGNGVGGSGITAGTPLGSLGVGSSSFQVRKYTVTSTDVSNGYLPVTVGAAGGCGVSVYRGPTTAFFLNFGDQDSSTASPVVCPGITKNASSKVLVYGFVSVNAAETISVSGPTQRATSANNKAWIGDYDTSSTYANGTSISFGYSALADVFAPVVELR